jgi:hypothetical protein
MFMSRVGGFAQEIRREKSALALFFLSFFLSFFVPLRLASRKESSSVPRTSQGGGGEVIGWWVEGGNWHVVISFAPSAASLAGLATSVAWSSTSVVWSAVSVAGAADNVAVAVAGT